MGLKYKSLIAAGLQLILWQKEGLFSQSHKDSAPSVSSSVKYGHDGLSLH